jgi:hypothetical protein
MHDSLPRFLHHLLFAALSANPLEMLKVASVYRRDVFAAENANLKLLGRRITRRETSAGALEVPKSLVDDVVCTDMLCNSCRVAVVRDKLRRRGQIDTVDVPESVSVMVGHIRLEKPWSTSQRFLLLNRGLKLLKNTPGLFEKFIIIDRT